MLSLFVVQMEHRDRGNRGIREAMLTIKAPQRSELIETPRLRFRKVFVDPIIVIGTEEEVFVKYRFTSHTCVDPGAFEVYSARCRPQ